MKARRLPAGRIRLGMRLANGSEVVEVVRPDRRVVKRGYGRVCLGLSDGSGYAYYCGERLALADDEDAHPDTTMDNWPGAWWDMNDG